MRHLLLFLLSLQVSGFARFEGKTIDDYQRWHAEQLSALKADPSSCKDVKLLKFTPAAGLGDAAYQLSRAFIDSMRSGSY